MEWPGCLTGPLRGQSMQRKGGRLELEEGAGGWRRQPEQIWAPSHVRLKSMANSRAANGPVMPLWGARMSVWSGVTPVQGAVTSVRAAVMPVQGAATPLGHVCARTYMCNMSLEWF